MYPFNLEQGNNVGYNSSTYETATNGGAFGEVQQAASTVTGDWDEEMRKLLWSLEAKGEAAEKEKRVEKAVEVKDGLSGWSWENVMGSETMLGLAV